MPTIIEEHFFTTEGANNFARVLWLKGHTVSIWKRQWGAGYPVYVVESHV